MPRLKTDPARFEVVKNALTCAAEEMKIVLAKTAYSPLLKVAGDYSCGIFDVGGNMVAQGPDLPIHLGSMPDAVRAVVQAFPDVGTGRRVHPQRSVSGRLASAGRERRRACLPRRPAARLRLRARALARHRQRHARQLRRGDGNLRRGAAPAAYTSVSRRQARSRHRGDHLRQCPHAHRAARRPARAGGGELARRRTAAGSGGQIRHRHAAGHHAGGAGLLRNHDARRAARVARWRGGVFRCLRRRRRHRARRHRGRDLHREAAHHQARRHDHRRLRRFRSAGCRADERAADRHRIRRVLRAEDDRRSEEPDPAQLRLLAAGDGDRAAGLGGERAASRAGGLRQPRDVASRRRHGDGGDVRLHAAHGDGGIAGHLGGDDLRRHRLSQRRALCQLRIGEGRLRRAAGEGWHQRRRLHRLQHDEHADRDHRDELSAARRGIRAGARQRRRRHLARRPRRAARVAGAGAAGPCGGLLRTHRHAAVRSRRRQGRRAGEARTDPAATATRAGSTARAASSRPPVRWW